MAKKAKQTEIPGTEQTHHADIIDAAEALEDEQEKLKAQRHVVERKEFVLRSKMREHKLEVYRLSDGRIVRVKVNEKAVVSKAKKPRAPKRKLAA